MAIERSCQTILSFLLLSSSSNLWCPLGIFWIFFFSWQPFLESSFPQWPRILDLSVNRWRKDGEWQVVVGAETYIGYCRYGALNNWYLNGLDCTVFSFRSISPSKHTPCAGQERSVLWRWFTPSAAISPVAQSLPNRLFSLTTAVHAKCKLYQRKTGREIPICEKQQHVTESF